MAALVMLSLLTSVHLIYAGAHQKSYHDNIFPRRSTRWPGVDMSTPLLPQVVPEIDAHPVSFFTVKGADGSRSRSVLDSPVCKIRRMRLIWCFRGASKSWKVFSFMLLRPPPDTRPLTRGSWCPGLRQGSSQIPVTGSRSSLRGNFCVQPTFFDLAALLGAQKKIPFVLPHEIRSYM